MSILVKVVTIALRMGVDWRGVKTTVHLGTSKNVKAFMQETKQYVLESQASPICYAKVYSRIMRDIKEHLKTKECHRKT